MRGTAVWLLVCASFLFCSFIEASPVRTSENLRSKTESGAVEEIKPQALVETPTVNRRRSAQTDTLSSNFDNNQNRFDNTRNNDRTNIYNSGTNYPINLRQDERLHSDYGYNTRNDQRNPVYDPYDPYRVQNPQFQRGQYAPLRRSFQATSYVYDQVPATIFKKSDRLTKTQKDDLPFQSATVTERNNDLAKLYLDEYDENENLTKIEERVKIFYGGNHHLAPKFKNIAKEEKALKQQNRLFSHFKTQRANSVLKENN